MWLHIYELVSLRDTLEGGYFPIQFITLMVKTSSNVGTFVCCIHFMHRVSGCEHGNRAQQSSTTANYGTAHEKTAVDLQGRLGGLTGKTWRKQFSMKS